MPTGRLGTANITTTADTTIYTVPLATFAVVSLNIVNRSTTTAASIRIALSSTTTPSLDEYLEFDSELVARGVLERTGIVMDSGKLLVVSTPTASPTLSVVAYGIETSTT
jgi:hypothetical protein